MVLKLKDEVLHSVIMNESGLEDLASDLQISLRIDCDSNVQNRVESNHVLNSLENMRYEIEGSEGIENNFYAISPVYVPFVKTNTTNDFGVESSLTINPKIMNDKPLSVISLQKEMDSKNNLFNNQDLLNWLRFLNKQNITNNLSYILALKNIQTIYNSNNISNDVLWFKSVPLISKQNKLRNINNVIKKSSYTSMVEYRQHDPNTALKSILSNNKKLSKVANSRQPFYLNISEKQAHKDITNVIFGMREYLLMSKIKDATPIVCPKCHIYTYDCFPYCQNCGAKLKPVAKSENKDK